MLQFQLFLRHNEQNIPVIIPGSDADGSAVMKFLNMLLCGSVFLTLAVWARKITVATQTSVVELVRGLHGATSDSAYAAVPQQSGLESKSSEIAEEEVVELTKVEGGMSS